MSQIKTADNMCTLKARDGINVVVPLDVAKISITIKNMLEDLGEISEDDEYNIIPIPNIDGVILKKIYEYCNYIHKNPQDLDTINIWLNDKNFSGPPPEWYNEFLNIDQSTLFEIIVGANFLDIKQLLDMTCKTISNIIRNNTHNELRCLFKNPEEEVVIN